MMSIFVMRVTLRDFQNDAAWVLAGLTPILRDLCLFATKLLLDLRQSKHNTSPRKFCHPRDFQQASIILISLSESTPFVLLYSSGKPKLWIDVEEAVVVVARPCWRPFTSFSSFYSSDQRCRYGFTSRQQFGLKAK